jgi:hypothetical protein
MNSTVIKSFKSEALALICAAACDFVNWSQPTHAHSSIDINVVFFIIVYLLKNGKWSPRQANYLTLYEIQVRIK